MSMKMLLPPGWDEFLGMDDKEKKKDAVPPIPGSTYKRTPKAPGVMGQSLMRQSPLGVSGAAATRV
jgi:hypothetical protein